VISPSAEAYLRLSLVRGIGPRTGRKIVQRCGDIRALWQQSRIQLQSLEDISLKLIEALLGSDVQLTQSVIEFCQHAGISVVGIEDDAYPELLLPLEDAPLVLFVRGHVEALLHHHMLAVVGSRKASAEDKWIARKWSRELSANDVCVVSGMAYGIDSAAHRGALDASSPTMAVLGCGLSTINTLQDRQVRAICDAGGVVVSEFLPQQEARAEFFPRRNRVIAGLSHATLVVAAEIRSGSLITANLAAGYGREVMVVPGSVLNSGHSGCHQLIRDGALLVDSTDAVLQAMQWRTAECNRSVSEILSSCTDDERRLVMALDSGVLHLDAISDVCGLTITELSPILLALELREAIVRLPGSRYALAK